MPNRKKDVSRKMDSYIRIVMTKKLFEDLFAAADDLEIPTSEFVRQAIRTKLAQLEQE